MSGRKTLLADLNQNGKFEQDEIITVSSQSAQLQAKGKSNDKASDKFCKKMKIRPQKERIHDKSYEL